MYMNMYMYESADGPDRGNGPDRDRGGGYDNSYQVWHRVSLSQLTAQTVTVEGGYDEYSRQLCYVSGMRTFCVTC